MAERKRTKIGERINLNTLALDVKAREGGKKKVDIAQTKEILSITLDELAKYDAVQVLTAIYNRKKK